MYRDVVKVVETHILRFFIDLFAVVGKTNKIPTSTRKFQTAVTFSKWLSLHLDFRRRVLVGNTEITTKRSVLTFVFYPK